MSSNPPTEVAPTTTATQSTTFRLGRNALTPPSAWTLRTKLVASVVSLFFVVTVVTGSVTILYVRAYLTTQLTNGLLNTAQRFGSGAPLRGGGGGGGPDGPIGAGGAVLRLELSNGTIVTNGFGQPINFVVNNSNQDDTLDAAQIARLNAAQLTDRPKRVDVGGDVGTYLLISTRTVEGYTSIVGVPTGQVDKTLDRVVALLAGGSILGLLAGGVGGTYLVRRNLEPLTRVASTARRVSQLKLDSGDVALAERVPPADADPRSEVGQVGLAINSMLDNVDGALQSRQESETRARQFVADASHELRTPLASIRGYAELSRREKEPVPPSVRHALGRVESEALRMTSLVEDLLLLARLDSGRPLEREPVDLSLLAMDAVSDAHAASPEHTWELDIPDAPVEVPGDRERLHQVVVNLLANARTHTPDGTTVVLAVHPEGDLVRVSVRDNGPGVPESLQRNVFQRFTRGDDSRSRAAGSTGLGLSIVAAVAGAHHGRVELTSKPGDTTFSILLPVA